MGASSSQIYNPSDAKAAEIDNIALATNIVLVPFSILLENKKRNNEAPQYCRGCGAALSMYSTVQAGDAYLQKMAGEPLSDVEKAREEEEEHKGEEKREYLKGKYIKDVAPNELVWICEYCGVHNKLPSIVIFPQSEREFYILKKAQSEVKQAEEAKEQAKHVNETSIIFCIDVSGSMGCTHEVNKNGKMEYVSRIQLISEAVLKQLKDMKESHPHRKIGVVLFGGDVTLKGDCSKPEVQLLGDLNSFESIFNDAMTGGETLITKNLTESYHKLEQAIKELEIGGGTALGPGLLSALALATQGKTGSRIILCTDGLANVGIGSLENSGDVATSQKFYEKVGDMAVDKGVSISIITIKGQACKVDALGPLTDRTAGQIIRVDPTKINLADIAANNLIAINVKLRAIMHEGLAFKNEDPHNLKNNGSVLVKQIGSVSTNNEAYFEYRVKTVDELKNEGVSLEDLESLPLQAQISYTDLQGNEIVLIVSQKQQLTKDHKKAEKAMKADVIAGYVQKQSANLVLEGKVDEARKTNQIWAQQVERLSQNVEIDSENKKAIEEFKAQNQQLQALIDLNPMQNKGMNAVEKDEITSKLYEMKQQKQSKF